MMLLLPATVMADDIPLRYQRREVFRVLPTNENSIVFLGNSISHFGVWHKMFNDGNIVNRGISGNLSGEVLEHLDLIVAGQPKKLFLMIGINDFENREVVVPNIRRIIEVTKQESPKTEIYIQSLLPCNRSERQGMVEPINEKLEALCEELGVTYIDVYSKVVDNINAAYPTVDPQHSNDNLHVTASGYREWTSDYEQYVGKANVFAAGNGKFYLISAGGYYLVCRQWNVDASNNGEKSQLGMEYVNETEFYILNGSQYFKVGEVDGEYGVYYPYCDAP